jgi:hypothetical protein
MSVTKRELPSEHIAVRVDQPMIDEIDAVAREICPPYGTPKRAEAMRALIGWGLGKIDEVGLDVFLTQLDVEAPRGRGRVAMTFNEKKHPQTKRRAMDDEE